jgi:hypothetical protein
VALVNQTVTVKQVQRDEPPNARGLRRSHGRRNQEGFDASQRFVLAFVALLVALLAIVLVMGLR